MLQTEIRREVVPVPMDTVEVASLAEQAETLLGYKVLKQTISKTDANAPALARVLRDLDITILNKADVETYQKEHLLEIAKHNFGQWMISMRGPQDVFYCPRWERMPIDNYQQPVPEFVLNKAIQIKQAWPEVKFCVEYLNESPDPFLIACRTERTAYSWNTGVGDNMYDAVKEEYIVECWAEPKFEQKL